MAAARPPLIPPQQQQQQQQREGGMAADVKPKRGTRQRLLHGLQRISSSPSLASSPGRSRSASSPGSFPASFSCISLASSSATTNTSTSPSPFAQTSPAGSASYFSHGSSSSTATTGRSTPQTSVPTSPSPDFRAFGGGGVVVEQAGTTKTAGYQTDGEAAVVKSLPQQQQRQTPPFSLWTNMPRELRIRILSFLQPKELVRASRASRGFHALCFDGQLWTSFDASEFYADIPAQSLANIIVAAGPFVKDLNLRGCVQIEHYHRAEVVANACRNLLTATLEGCRNLQKATLHNLLRNNPRLAHLDLKGLAAVTNTTCRIVARSLPQLEALDVSWCKHMDARGVQAVVEGCPALRDLSVAEIRGFDSRDVADALFRTNRLERLVLAGCADLTDQALRVAMVGADPEIDVLTDQPLVPPRRLRHLDLSRCRRLTSQGLRAALGHRHLLPDLEALRLAGNPTLTDAALEPLLAAAPRLTLLDLEDLALLTDGLLAEHLAKAPCARRLEHLGVSYCELIGDRGMLPVLRACTALRCVEMDNTRVSDLSLAEAAAMVRSRAASAATAATTTTATTATTAATPNAKHHQRQQPYIGLSLVVYDCPAVTWTGVREVLSRNAEIRRPSDASATTYPSEIIGLRCFYGWQMTVDEHTKRVLAGDLPAAARLERKWAEYMQASEEAGVEGAGMRRRRRRARLARQAHADEEEGGGGGGGGGSAVVVGRRRARTTACLVM